MELKEKITRNKCPKDRCKTYLKLEIRKEMIKHKHPEDRCETYLNIEIGKEMIKHKYPKARTNKSYWYKHRKIKERAVFC